MSNNTTIQFETNRGSMTVVGCREVITPAMLMRLKQVCMDSGLQVKGVQIVSDGSWGANSLSKEEQKEVLTTYYGMGRVAAIRMLRTKRGLSLIEASATLEHIKLLGEV